MSNLSLLLNKSERFIGAWGNPNKTDFGSFWAPQVAKTDIQSPCLRLSKTLQLTTKYLIKNTKTNTLNITNKSITINNGQQQ